ncbi:F-box domain protein [Aspergillus stella-maris]|uniref:F-box domain protein n=1 Tax=Aspergillus stella-maris TaxID=1810926 RepID=UPI003CCD5C1D
MDPNIRDIITRFKELDTTTSARRIAYHQIIDQLDPYEWRDVTRRMNARSFSKDILGALPLEIAVEIVQYLDLAELYALRRVSRRWHEILSSKAACSVLYRKYTGCILGDDFENTFARFSKRRLRLEQGKPSASLQVDFSELSWEEQRTLDSMNGRYVWLTDNDTALVVWTPGTGKKQRFCTEHRRQTLGFCLTSYLVAAITMRGYCHAWDLQTEEQHTARLPNAKISLFAASSFRIAVYFEDLEGGLVMHFDLQSKKTHSVQNVQNLVLMCLDAPSGQLVLIHFNQGCRVGADDTAESPHLYIQNYELHENGDVSRVGPAYPDISYQSYWSRVDLKINYEVQARYRSGMGILTAWSEEKNDFVLVLSITYHSQTGRIHMHPIYTQGESIPRMVKVDEDIIYFVRTDYFDPRIDTRTLWIHNSSATPREYPAKSMHLDAPRDLLDGDSLAYSSSVRIIGDSRLLTMVEGKKTYVWSFEEVDDLENTSYPLPGYP